MKNYADGRELVVELEGKFDSVTAQKTEEEILRIWKEHPGLALCLDAERLDYISSTGLRSLLRLSGMGNEKLIIRNPSPSVLEVLDVTGISTMLSIRKKRRELSVEDCEIIGKGAFGTVYRLDADTVVKVYRNGEDSLPIIENEQLRSRQAFLAGLPTAIPFDIVRVGDQYGSVFELIRAENCNDLLVKNPGYLEKLIPAYASFLKAVHSSQTWSGQMESAKEIWLRNLDAFSPRIEGRVGADVISRLKKLLTDMPDDLHLIHGDVQLKNVMLSGDQMILLDMDHICTGNPVFEFASLFASYIAFNEDDPEDSVKFCGLTGETVSRLFHGTLKSYLGDPTPEELNRDMVKIMITGYIRFLTILLLENVSSEDDLLEIRLRHVSEHLRKLAFETENLLL